MTAEYLTRQLIRQNVLKMIAFKKYIFYERGKCVKVVNKLPIFNPYSCPLRCSFRSVIQSVNAAQAQSLAYVIVGERLHISTISHLCLTTTALGDNPDGNQ